MRGMPPIERIVVLGAGHVGTALSHVCGAAGVRHAIVDDRRRFARSDRLPSAETVLCMSFPAALEELDPDARSAVVILTRCHRTDMVCLERALSTDAGYIGLIASRHKVAWMSSAFARRGIHPFTDSRVHAPLGLDLGDPTPGGIALSILAEVLTLSSGAR